MREYMPEIEPTTVTFIGGPNDGTVATTGDEDQLSAMAAGMAYLCTEGGTKIGGGFQGYSIAGVKALVECEDRSFRAGHQYVLAEASRVDGRLHLRMEYAPKK